MNTYRIPPSFYSRARSRSALPRGVVSVMILVVLIELSGCGWDIVRDGPQNPNVHKMDRPTGKCAYVYLNYHVQYEKTPDFGNYYIPSTARENASRFFESLKQQIAQTGAFSDVKEFDGITPIGPGDVLIRASASKFLPSEKGEGLDWRKICAAFVLPLFIYQEDAYPYIRYFEMCMLRSDGAELVTYFSRQSARPRLPGVDRAVLVADSHDPLSGQRMAGRDSAGETSQEK